MISVPDGGVSVTVRAAGFPHSPVINGTTACDGNESDRLPEQRKFPVLHHFWE